DRIALNAMAERADLPLGAGLAATGARASADFTPFDGNTELVVGPGDVQRAVESMRRISASGIESWATCPFQFFLGRVLRIDATARPWVGWTVHPLHRGSQVRLILERSSAHLRSEERFEVLDTYSSDDYRLVEAIPPECFGDF